MRVAVFSTKSYDRTFLTAENVPDEYGSPRHELEFFETRLTNETVAVARGYRGVCAFVNDDLNAHVVEQLAAGGTELIALRAAGFNNVDLQGAAKHGITVMRVPEYSPYAVAEHTVALMLSLNRKIPRAASRVREGNFRLTGLLGFDMHGCTAGIIGTGKIGTAVAHILRGIGCRLLAYDPYPTDVCRSLGVEYVDLETIFRESRIITLHTPLTPMTYHLIGETALAQMRDGVMLINTSRGALLDTEAVIVALKRGRIGYLGLDVYEQEEHLFFRDLSDQVLTDDTFARLLTFPNVLITGHQAFFTHDALTTIARTTIGNISAFERGELSGNEVVAERVIA